MTKQLNVWFLNRRGEISQEPVIVEDYDINRDYITQEKSEFTLPSIVAFEKGDFLFAKFSGGSRNVFFGIIDSYEGDKVVATDIYNLVNFDFPATRISGSSFESHFYNLINRYLVQDTTKQMSILDVEVRTNTAHIYQPSEPPTATNLVKYAINAFKKYNVIWEFDRFENGRIKTYLEHITDMIQLKNNVYDFVNWEVSTTEVGKNTENMLLIVNKNTNNSEGPNILATWYLTTNNEVTQNSNDSAIFKPTKTKVHIYDTTATDAPSYSDVANSELKGNYYSHEINFDIKNESEIIDFESLRIGTLANIYYNEKLFQSVLTGYQITSNSDFIGLKFGHIRSRLSEVLE